MNIYYVKILIFTFLVNTLILSHNENCQNNQYNISLIKNNTQRTTIKPRLLAQTKNHNPHYHNDPELKEMIDKLNKEAIKKYQKIHEPYEQLQELVEKKGTKPVGEHGTEPMSTIEKELLETYEKMFGDKKDIMLKSGMPPNDDDRSDKSITCECTDINNPDLTKAKSKDKYLKRLKEGCTRGICTCSVGSAFLTLIGLAAAKKAAVAAFSAPYDACVSSTSLFYIFDSGTLASALKVGSTCASVATDMAGTVSSAATTAIIPFSISIYVLIVITVLLIILYIWLYRRRKNSWKHECKKHLCK
ncbi:stevor [Plasmodium falciparum NF54]|uniref:Stevor n=2 Tax=Plasmodium falciparum TaxID=5833 RepID=C6KT16_PLAF7|nr:stevor [Plasmodium falciparum 3D7]EWC89718.1 hypothetical protein PFNF54_01518 [Plasmodium falciparum NF54]KAF4327674.1 stevor [Plasmodium falciparum NF54]PKC43060.1 stevor [Plasmodium falciparum NF54]CAG24991.1 stevor [Plasmodium falciparum 3D7]|eukprot:XP_966161.1 stevor [Plasmodium falciparum 3D7]